jgi:hypothetical protein
MELIICYLAEGKSKATSLPKHRAMKARGEHGGKVPCFLDPDTTSRKMIRFTVLFFTSENGPQVHIA